MKKVNVSTKFDWENYIDSLKKINKKLEAHPDIKVISFSIGNPATDEDVIETEKALGKPLPELAKQFYKHIGSLNISWVSTKNYINYGLSNKSSIYNNGLVNIKELPIRENLFDDSEIYNWEDIDSMSDSEVTDWKHYIAFDTYNLREGSFVGFLLDDDVNPDISGQSNKGDECFISPRSRDMNLEQYLESIIQTYGMNNRYFWNCFTKRDLYTLDDIINGKFCNDNIFDSYLYDED